MYAYYKKISKTVDGVPISFTPDIPLTATAQDLASILGVSEAVAQELLNRRYLEDPSCLPPCTDPLPTITNVQVSQVTINSAFISWSQNFSGTVTVNIAGNSVGTSASSNYSFSNLNPATNYSGTLTFENCAGAVSVPFNFRTAVIVNSASIQRRRGTGAIYTFRSNVNWSLITPNRLINFTGNQTPNNYSPPSPVIHLESELFFTIPNSIEYDTDNSVMSANLVSGHQILQNNNTPTPVSLRLLPTVNGCWIQPITSTGTGGQMELEVFGTVVQPRISLATNTTNNITLSNAQIATLWSSFGGIGSAPTGSPTWRSIVYYYPATTSIQGTVTARLWNNSSNTPPVSTTTAWLEIIA